MGNTIFEKIWDRHVVRTIEGGPSVLYIDKHLIHEVTSPQAFKGIEKRGLEVFRPAQIVATADHNVPTIDQHLPIKDELSRIQVQQLIENCARHHVELYGLGHPYQGIVHVIGPELGITQPGMTIVCGDSHTSTHGAFGSLAFGIGTSEVKHVLATQCLPQKKPKTMQIDVRGKLREAVRGLSMEGRMTLCNMSIEAGARAGMIAPDETTFAYVQERRFAPKGEDWEDAFVFYGTPAT